MQFPENCLFLGRLDISNKQKRGSLKRQVLGFVLLAHTGPVTEQLNRVYDQGVC